MNISFNKSDEELIKLLMSEEYDMRLISPKTKECIVNFKVTDPYKFTAFLNGLIYDNVIDRMRNEFGFEITSVNEKV